MEVTLKYILFLFLVPFVKMEGDHILQEPCLFIKSPSYLTHHNASFDNLLLKWMKAYHKVEQVASTSEVYPVISPISYDSILVTNLITQNLSTLFAVRDDKNNIFIINSEKHSKLVDKGQTGYCNDVFISPTFHVAVGNISDLFSQWNKALITLPPTSQGPFSNENVTLMQVLYTQRMFDLNLKKRQKTKLFFAIPYDYFVTNTFIELDQFFGYLVKHFWWDDKQPVLVVTQVPVANSKISNDEQIIKTIVDKLANYSFKYNSSGPGALAQLLLQDDLSFTHFNNTVRKYSKITIVRQPRICGRLRDAQEMINMQIRLIKWVECHIIPYSCVAIGPAIVSRIGSDLSGIYYPDFISRTVNILFNHIQQDPDGSYQQWNDTFMTLSASYERFAYVWRSCDDGVDCDYDMYSFLGLSKNSEIPDSILFVDGLEHLLRLGQSKQRFDHLQGRLWDLSVVRNQVLQGLRIKMGVSDMITNNFTIHCEMEKTRVVIFGGVIKLSQFGGTFGGICGNETFLKEVVLMASDVVYFDEDVAIPGLEVKLVVIAGRWGIVGKQRKVLLVGDNGTPYQKQKAESGSYPSGNGTNGRAGVVGGNGGSFSGIYRHLMKTFEGSHINSVTYGGKGGPGQDGGDGADGITGEYVVVGNIHIEDITPFRFNKDKFKVVGKPGTEGGVGGNGGAKGLDGIGGTVLVIDLKHENDSINTVINTPDLTEKYNNGVNYQGLGGYGGNSWSRVESKCSAEKNIYGDMDFVNCTKYRITGGRERGGIEGGNYLNVQKPLHRDNPQGTFCRAISDFKRFYSKYGHGTMAEEMEASFQLTKRCSSLQSFLEQLTNLELKWLQNEKASKDIALITEYNQLLHSVENYTQDKLNIIDINVEPMSYVERKILSYLNAAVFSKFMVFNISCSGYLPRQTVHNNFTHLPEKWHRYVKDGVTAEKIIAEMSEKSFHHICRQYNAIRNYIGDTLQQFLVDNFVPKPSKTPPECDGANRTESIQRVLNVIMKEKAYQVKSVEHSLETSVSNMIGEIESEIESCLKEDVDITIALHDLIIMLSDYKNEMRFFFDLKPVTSHLRSTQYSEGHYKGTLNPKLDEILTKVEFYLKVNLIHAQYNNFLQTMRQVILPQATLWRLEDDTVKVELAPYFRQHQLELLVTTLGYRVSNVTTELQLLYTEPTKKKDHLFIFYSVPFASVKDSRKLLPRVNTKSAWRLCLRQLLDGNLCAAMGLRSVSFSQYENASYNIWDMSKYEHSHFEMMLTTVEGLNQGNYKLSSLVYVFRKGSYSITYKLNMAPFKKHVGGKTEVAIHKNPISFLWHNLFNIN